MFSELAEISRNSSVISSSSSSSSLSDAVDARPARPARTFAAPRSASERQCVGSLPEFMQRSLGVSAGPSAHDFEFGDVLGHGSYSTVLSARARKTGRAYAVKVLDKAHLQRHNQRRTAYAEKDALVALGTAHAGVVGLHSTFSDAWSLYFVLDLLPNGDLRALIARYGSLSLPCTRYYVAQLADALAFVHAKGVMHRDVKPENLLLDARFRLALADFGTAKVLPPDGPRRSHTFVGTPQYYSPELLAHSYTCPASDLWALGCVLFELHTGTFAFNGPSPLLTWRLIKDLSYTIPDAFNTDAADLVRHLLLAEPADRLGANDMDALKNHSFFSSIDWNKIWDEPHPPLESGLKQAPEPVLPSSDAELSAQLREERMQDEDDDEIAWAKDARLAAYLPGLRHGNTLPAVQPAGEYKFPRLESEQEGIPYDAVDPSSTADVPASTDPNVANPAPLDSHPSLAAAPSSTADVPVSAHPDPAVPSSTADIPASTHPDPAVPSPNPAPLDISSAHPNLAHLLQSNETLILCTPLVPESSTPGGLIRLLPRLFKPKLKERVLLLTDRRVLCVSTGSKSVATIKAEYPLTSIKGVETRGNDSVTILINDKEVAYAFDDLGAQENWVKNIQGKSSEIK